VDQTALGLEFLQDLYDELNLRRVCQQLVLRMLKLEQKGQIRWCIFGDVNNMADKDIPYHHYHNG